VSPRAAFRCAEGWFRVSLRSTGRDKCHLSAGKQTLVPPRRRSRRHPVKNPCVSAVFFCPLFLV